MYCERPQLMRKSVLVFKKLREEPNGGKKKVETRKKRRKSQEFNLKDFNPKSCRVRMGRKSVILVRVSVKKMVRRATEKSTYTCNLCYVQLLTMQ